MFTQDGRVMALLLPPAIPEPGVLGADDRGTRSAGVAGQTASHLTAPQAMQKGRLEAALRVQIPIRD